MLRLPVSMILFVSVLMPALVFADVVGGCNFGLQNFSDRGSVLIFSRNGSLVMQTVLDDDVSVYSKLTTSNATGDQVRDESRQNTPFNKMMGDAHIFPSDVRTLKAYLADPVVGANDSVGPSASYYGFYGDQNVFLGGFGTIGKDWYICDWQ